METFADKIIGFNEALDFSGILPEGISIMNPFRDNENILPVSSAFYRKYYSDQLPRHLILGINPGRFGAGVTGIPFTDPKRLIEKCGIAYHGEMKHEPSSVFIYEMIDAFGGPVAFYEKFYINSVCPLGFTATGNNGKEVNCNYYDFLPPGRAAVSSPVYGFIVENIQKQIGMGVETDICYCFGNGKNEKFLRTLNAEKHFFGKIIALEHPRFVMQYKARSKPLYIDKYLSAFNQISC
ncbi:MAG: uracil-DNA glycosylase family protein [Bacteroidota bacterium]